MSDVTQGQDAPAPKAAAASPDVDALFPKQDVDDLFPANYKPPATASSGSSPIHDLLFASPSRSDARVLEAFGYGFKQNWGAGQREFSEADEALRKAGIYNDYAKGQNSIIKAANEAVMRPAVAAILSAKSLLSGAFGGTQAGIAQYGEEMGQPQLGREGAAMLEAFPTGIRQPTGIPHAPLPPLIERAKSLDVIGAGEDGYFGTKPVVEAAPEVPAEAAKAAGVTAKEWNETLLGQKPGEAIPSPTVQPAAVAEAVRAPEAPAVAAGEPTPGAAEVAKDVTPDIHTVARQIAPDTFSEFDALSQKKDTFRRWISELREVRDQNAREGAPHADEIASLDEQITAQQGKKGGYGKLQSLTSKRDALIEERDAYIAERTQGDSADMAKIRQQLMQADYRQRDLAADVSEAYREAELRMPKAEPAEAAEAPAAEAVAHEDQPPQVVPAQVPAADQAAVEPAKASAPAPEAAAAEVKPAALAAPAEAKALPIAHAPSIVADVSQKLKAAGRPAEEADAAAQIVAAYWETRAQRFEGAKGTAAEMYAREAPDIKAGKEKALGRQPEMAQTAAGQKGRIRLRDDGRATITLLKTADASTYIHETGHEWLERMLDDARDEQAPQALKDQANTVLKWLGVDSPDGVKTRHHEKFARGFETYMLEGRAPSSALARVFAKFKDWLTTIYRTAAALKAPISDDIRGVFDRLLAERPEKTVIAPERESGPSLADTHEKLAEETPAVAGFETSGKIRDERDLAAASGPAKDENARLGNAREGTEEHPPGGAESSGHADAAGMERGAAEASGGSGAVGEGGSEAAAEGDRPRKGSIGLVTRPTPLLRFIVSQGGIKASDALISDLRQSLGGNNRLIPGFGQLIRTPKQLSSAAKKSGRLEAMTIDRAREAAIEAGHLPEGASVTDFLDAIDNEVRGIGHGIERPHDPAEQAHAEHSFLEGINDAVKHAGGTELTDAERARALELRRDEGLNDPHAIIERLALEADDAHLDEGAPERLHGVPGWDVPAPGWDAVPDDGRPAHGEGSAIAPVEAREPGSGAARGGGEAQEQHPLDANATLPRSETKLIDKAGNIRLDNLGTPEDVNAVIRATAEANDDFLEARRGVISDHQVLALADALGMDASQLSARKLGQAFNAEQIVAARKLLIQSATAVRDAMAKAAEGTEADVLAYAEVRARHMMIQQQVAGITAEAGRALRAFRAIEGSQEAGQLTDFLKANTGKTLFQLQEEARLGSQLQTPSLVSKAIHEAGQTRWQKTRSGILSWFINNLISGPITHAGYSIGNTVVQLFKATVDTTAAAAYGALRDLPPGERVYFGEVVAQLYGMVRGMRDGYSPAITALKTGVPYMKGDVEGLIGQIEAAHRPQAIPGAVGYVMETPSRAVTAIHTMHYSMNYEAEIARRAYRSAMKDGLEPGTSEFNTKVADFTQSPPPAEMEAAHDEAMKMVLMKSAQFGTAQYHLQKAVNSNILAKIVMPFMQVGANILHESFVERTPLGLMSQTVRDNLSGKNGAVAQHTQAARISVGIGVSTAVIGLTAEGILTGGGPSDPKQLAIKEMTGWRPYSIRVGESYVPYRKYLGGLGPLIAGTADMYEVGHALNEEGLTKAAAASLFGFAEVIADESWARGLANFIDAARHWDRDGGRYLRNLAGDFIPFAIGAQQIATLNDPYRREVRSMLDVARAHIPGLSKGLFPVRDIWGEPIASHTALGPSTANHDPATQALLDAGYYPGKLERKIRGVELTDQQYDDFTRIAGRMARMRVSALVNTPGIAQIPQQIRAEKIKDIIESARESARSMILMQSAGGPNDIIAKATATKRAKISGDTVH